MVIAGYVNKMTYIASPCDGTCRCHEEQDHGEHGSPEVDHRLGFSRPQIGFFSLRCVDVLSVNKNILMLFHNTSILRVLLYLHTDALLPGGKRDAYLFLYSWRLSRNVISGQKCHKLRSVSALDEVRVAGGI
jgi:hypothetical protein